ncbi:predicted protein [Phaeodactylum tricornutum CCAP 1055/1]|jgi:hypothetical protein|uniref:MYND-type domain-containing protein n=2 Tax=Phaeodactylum tricornutum TaxID=2850 RepID=B7FT59_PHATC|nr:predicted protein [Phaeodactylum tricornutum CCAP 1055/1]EEC50913.1 predicted protein [Phaeodactylum tricornutum CCAP 1055/1]|eukprot:XP_002178099.1 predicted protein [Phaeodactylum tricornutum CCAP 1055/1]
MMDHFLSILPKGFFGRHHSRTAIPATPSPPPAAAIRVATPAPSRRIREEPRTKRARETLCRTPALVSTSLEEGEPFHERPVKRFRVSPCVAWQYTHPVPEPLARPRPTPVSWVSLLPEEVTAHCLSFLPTVEDRFALQCTNRQFRRISNEKPMMQHVAVAGDRETGMRGILQEHDTPETAAVALTPFCQAGNLEAIYMLGIIKSYCHQDVQDGIALLKRASRAGYVRATYALGLVLRDNDPKEASRYMRKAAHKGYLPALQEWLPAREMKRRYGEPLAENLREYLDPFGLNRLLARHYVRDKPLRNLNTSHCWNPLCGRWAFKAHTAHVVEEPVDVRVSRMKMCSRCCRAKYCSKLCQVYDWRSGRHKTECQFL